MSHISGTQLPRVASQWGPRDSSAIEHLHCPVILWDSGGLDVKLKSLYAEEEYSEIWGRKIKTY